MQPQAVNVFSSREGLRNILCPIGRKCVCGGDLHDSIILFGENLHKKALEDGFKNAEKADLCLVLGSSLTVTPAADMPRKVAERKKKLVVCNLQKTPLDESCSLR